MERRSLTALRNLTDFVDLTQQLGREMTRLKGRSAHMNELQVSGGKKDV